MWVFGVYFCLFVVVGFSRVFGWRSVLGSGSNCGFGVWWLFLWGRGLDWGVLEWWLGICGVEECLLLVEVEDCVNIGVLV